MGKLKPQNKVIPFWKKLGFDSEQEYQVNEWLLELKEKGLVGEINYQPSSIRLNEELIVSIPNGLKKPKKLSILKKHDYTMDFEITCSELLYDAVKGTHSRLFRSDDNKVRLEVKPDSTALKLVDSHGSTRLFTSRTQPWVYEKFGIFVNLCTPNILFSNTFVPKSLVDNFYYKKAIAKKGKLIRKGDSKVTWEIRTVEQFINNLNL